MINFQLRKLKKIQVQLRAVYRFPCFLLTLEHYNSYNSFFTKKSALLRLYFYYDLTKEVPSEVLRAHFELRRIFSV